MSEKFTVAVVDDHPLMQAGIVAALQSAADLEVVGTGASAQDALRIVLEKRPQIVLLDLSMPGGGLNAAKQICAQDPDVKVIFLTVSEHEDDVIAAMSNGASGYILKGISGPELVSTLQAVLRGETYITPNLAARLLQKNRAPATATEPAVKLTAREEQILQEVKAGMTNKEIARKLALSEKTVKHYMTSVLQKLHARNRVEAALAERPKR